MNLVSVVIPYYKKKEYFRETIDSVINQTYKNLEIIIIYDDNEKNDLKYIKDLTSKDNRIKLIINELNMGVGLSRNEALKIFKGEYVAFLDSDDIWLAEKIEKQINLMENQKILFSHTSYEIIDKFNKTIGTLNAKENLSYSDLLKSCDIGLSTVILNAKIVEKNLFPSLKTKEDYVAWLKLAKKNIKIVGLNLPLTKWRKVSNSLSSSNIQKILDAFKVYRNYEKKSFLFSIVSILILSIYAMKKKFTLKFKK